MDMERSSSHAPPSASSSSSASSLYDFKWFTWLVNVHCAGPQVFITAVAEPNRDDSRAKRTQRM